METVESFKPYVVAMIHTLNVLGVVLNILIWRYRKLSRVLIYYECVMQLTHALVPYQYGEFQGLLFQMKMLWVYITSCCTPEVDHIVTFVTEAIIELALLPLIFND